MPTPEAQDQQFVAQLLTELGKIGGAGDWLTTPNQVFEGSPYDAVADAALQLVLDHYRTANRDADTEVSRHAWTLSARVWIIVKRIAADATHGRKLLREAAADVVRALQAAEDTFVALTGDVGVRCGDYQVHADLESAGFAAATLEVTVQCDQVHGAR